MQHLKTFEGFIIPKSARKFHPWWKDEDIALQLLKDLKSMKDDWDASSKLNIQEQDGGYRFDLDGFEFWVKWGWVHQHSNIKDGSLSMNGDALNVSSEVCKQIKDIIIHMKTFDERKAKEDDKKAFNYKFQKK